MGFHGMMDDDDFFSGGMGSGMKGFSQIQSSSFSAKNGGPVNGTSVKTQTFVENGKRTTRTEKTTVDRNGRSVTEVTEETDDGRGNRKENSYIKGDPSIL